MPKNIIIFASGTGTNAENICKVFAHHPHIQVQALFCNNPNAGVLDKMKPLGIPIHLFNRSDFANEASFLKLIQQYKPDLIVLAGFLWLIPPYLVNAFPRKIINIHPALLPKFGGKGMYGHHVHEAVLAAKEKEHGITIHFVTDKYDEGPPIFQARFDVNATDNIATISHKISVLEMQYFPEAIRRVLGA
jgi:phosphoribosylglycinamide formyltransferase-1